MQGTSLVRATGVMASAGGEVTGVVPSCSADQTMTRAVDERTEMALSTRIRTIVGSTHFGSSPLSSRTDGLTLAEVIKRRSARTTRVVWVSNRLGGEQAKLGRRHLPVGVRRLLAALFGLLVVPLGAPCAKAETDADWAWPGMQFDIFAGGSWHACSVGYPAWDRAGTRYFITAGHCFRDESGRHYVHRDGTALAIYSPSNHTTPVGFERTYPQPGDGWYTDISLVEMYPGRKLHGEGWEHIPDGPATAYVGDTACLVGFRHDKANCGKITETDAVITEDGYRWSTSATKASYCSHHGDSGGAVYNSNGALGIGITGSDEHNEPGTPGECRSSFIPIRSVLKFLRNLHPSLAI